MARYQSRDRDSRSRTGEMGQHLQKAVFLRWSPGGDEKVPKPVEQLLWGPKPGVTLPRGIQHVIARVPDADSLPPVPSGRSWWNYIFVEAENHQGSQMYLLNGAGLFPYDHCRELVPVPTSEAERSGDLYRTGEERVEGGLTPVDLQEILQLCMLRLQEPSAGL